MCLLLGLTTVVLSLRGPGYLPVNGPVPLRFAAAAKPTSERTAWLPLPAPPVAIPAPGSTPAPAPDETVTTVAAPPASREPSAAEVTTQALVETLNNRRNKKAIVPFNFTPPVRPAAAPSTATYETR